MKNVAITFAKVVGWITASVLFLSIIIIILVQIPGIQNIIIDKVTQRLSEQLDTEVSIGNFRLAIPEFISLSEIYVEDQQNDTLLYTGNIRVDLDFSALLDQKIQVDRLTISNLVANLDRPENDSSFNYNFIIESFSSDQPETSSSDTTEGSNWSFGLDNIDLRNINFSMKDHYGGSIMSYEIGDFRAQLANMALDTLNFDINSIELNDSRGMIRITKSVPDTTESESTPFYLGLDQMKLRNINFSFDNQVDSMSFDVEMGNFQASADKIDFPGQNFQLDRVQLENIKANYRMFSPVDSTSADSTNENSGSDSPPWIFSSNQLELDNINFSYHNTALQVQEKGIDFNHLGVQDLDFAVNELYFSTDLVVKGEIERMNFNEKSGFSLKDLTTDLTFSNQEARLENFALKTSNSDIQRTLIATFPDLNEFTNQPEQVKVNVDLNETEIGLRDVLYFMPDLGETINPAIIDQKILLNIRLEGSLADLMIKQARMQALNSTLVDLEGNIRNLMQQENLFFNLSLNQLTTIPADMQQFLPAGTLPDSLNLPKRINLAGTLNGHIDQFTSRIDLNTSLGDLNARVAMSGLNDLPQYRANLTLNQIKVGTILQNDSLIGPVSMSGKISGKQFDLSKMELDYEFRIPDITLLNYTYDSIGIKGNLKDQLVNAHLAVLDSNLLLDFNGMASLNPENPIYRANLQLKGADFAALEFTEEELSANGSFVADFSGESLSNLQGELDIKNVNVIKEGKSYRIDSLIFLSLNETGKTDLSIESDFLDAEVKGNLEVTELVPVIKRHINQYYAIKSLQSIDVDTLESQDFTFSIDLKDPQILTEVLVPGLENYIPGEINGSFDSRKNNLAVNISIPQLTYNSLSVDTLVMNITSDQEMMYYVLSISQLAQGNINLQNFGVSGLIYDDRIETRVQITDQERQEQYAFGGIFTSQETDYRFEVEPPELILNYATWQVNPESYISLGDQIYINDLDISRDGQQIILNTINKGDSTIRLEFDEFHLETISRMIESEESLFRGIMNGSAEFNSGPEGIAFNSELKIDDFSFKQDTLGLITLNAANNTEGILELGLFIEGNENDVAVTGTFDPTPEEAVLDMTAMFNNLNLASVQGFAESQFSTLDGSMAGELNVNGTVSKPKIDGELHFKEATLALELLGSKFSLDNERILFNSKGIEFNDFQLTDKNGNNANIDGMIKTQDFQDFEFDLSFNSEDFLVMNTTKETGQPYYGTAIIDTDAQITGDLSTPQIATNIFLQEGTVINYALPETEPVTVEQEGIVRFVDKDQNLNPILRQALEAERDTTTMKIEGMDLTANIQIDNNVQVRIIIDEDAGDYLQVRGSSTLSLEIDPTGNISLTGRYQIQDGKYQLSFYQFVKREFLIERGSSITWSGDPYKATLDITAINIVDTSPMEIMTSNSSSMSRQEATQYSEIVPIAVRLNMKGELTDPQISFALNVAEGEQGALASQVSNRLDQINEQENELNKQVFSLLVLQRFLPNNPFGSGGGGGLSATARSSVSKLLTQQLNRLSQNLKGVDLTFDVQSYELGQSGGASEARTELEIGLSKSFFNDRVNVKVGSNIDLEGPQASEQESMSDYVGDIQVQYKLTPDGRLLLEFFRSNVYEEMIEAELVETGMGLIFRRDYNKLREIFKETEDDKGFK